MVKIKSAPGPVESKSTQNEDTLTFVFQVSRLVQNEEGKLGQLVLREYHQPRDGKVKALARYYFNWDVPSISGLAVAHEYRNEIHYTDEVESNAFTRVVLPFTKWDNELRRQLKPFKGKLLNVKQDEQGVSKFYGLQLRVTVKGNPTVTVEHSTWEGNTWAWETYQFEPRHIVKVELVSAVEDRFILPFLSGQEVDFMLAMESKNKTRKRRGKNRAHYALQAKREELKELSLIKEEAKAVEAKANSNSIKEDIQAVEAEIQQTLAEIEALTQ